MPAAPVRRFAPPLALAALLLTACGEGVGGGGTDTAGIAQAPAADAGRSAAAEQQGTIEGFRTPESVLYDAEQDVYFVSNINGNPSQKDGNGYIARVAAGGDRAVTMAVEGGKNGVTLHAPKGMALVGDTLWVADIDAVRGFDRRTGRPLATVTVPQPVHFLNDVAAGPDGALYVTDTGIRFDASGGMSAPSTGQIFRIANGRATRASAAGDSLANPNGITYDRARSAFIVVPFNGTQLFAWSPGSAPRPLASGPGQYDGVEVVGDRVLVSSWADSTVHVLAGGASTLAPFARGLQAPADIGVDTRRALLLVPRFMDDRVDLWSIPGGVGASTTARAPADTGRR